VNLSPPAQCNGMGSKTTHFVVTVVPHRGESLGFSGVLASDVGDGKESRVGFLMVSTCLFAFCMYAIFWGILAWFTWCGSGHGK